MPVVLHVAQPTVAGVPVVVRSMVRDQLERGWDVRVACPDDGDLPGWVRELGAQHLTWSATREPGPSTLAETRALAKVLRTVSPDVVHLHSAKAGLAGRLALRRKLPTLFQPHAWSFEAVDGVVGRAARAWERSAARWTSLLVCVSEDERRRGQDVGVRGPSLVAPNGVDLALLTPVGPQQQRDARHRLGLPDGRPVVVCVGRLARQKGQDVLLDSLPQLLEQVPGLLTVLVGQGPDDEVLAARAGTDVLLTGARADAADWLAAADVVALPSRWEAGLSLVAMEAMALQRPVVSLIGYSNPKRVGPYRWCRDLMIDAYGEPGEDYPISMENRLDRMPRISVRDVLDRVERWRTNYRSAVE